MSVHFDRVRGRWIVRWRDNGKQRARRFADEPSAHDFEGSLVDASASPADYVKEMDGAR